MFKTCPKCKCEKPKSDYSVQSINSDGLSTYCKECNSKRNRAYRLLSPEKKRAYELKKKFGLTVTQYNALFVKQDGRCAICFLHQSEQKRAFSVDHDHETGEIRGLLCHNCNVGLGNFHDEVEFLENAIKYLKQQAFTGLKVVGHK